MYGRMIGSTEAIAWAVTASPTSAGMLTLAPGSSPGTWAAPGTSSRVDGLVLFDG
jgi:hypothetical protein